MDKPDNSARKNRSRPGQKKKGRNGRGRKPNPPRAEGQGGRPKPYRKSRRPNQQRSGQARQAGGENSIPDSEPMPLQGVLEVLPDGYGFLRDARNSYQSTNQDPFLPAGMIRETGLRSGCSVNGIGAVRNGKLQVHKIESIEGVGPDQFGQRQEFTKLTSIDPIEPLRIAEGNDLSMRILDLITPIGKGQRGLIVAPPRTGKTILLQKLANSIVEQHPEVHLMMVLVDERPEEVTEMRRSIKAEVIHSSNDHPSERHIKVVEMVLERARRMVEMGNDVVILLDSLTRVARAYNSQTKGSGRTLSGGLDIRTMAKPREFFGAARKAEEGGSLTIIATALIDTGSRMDEVIFEEFKGTGNMELFLHRPLADRRIWPAIHIHQSGTRKEEKLRPPEVQRKVNMLRRALADASPEDALQLLRSKVEKTASNDQFFSMLS